VIQSADTFTEITYMSIYAYMHTYRKTIYATATSMHIISPEEVGLWRLEAEHLSFDNYAHGLLYGINSLSGTMHAI
jgi:hypothetical protein